MQHQAIETRTRSAQDLRDMLIRWRDYELACARDDHRDEDAEALSVPGDDLDVPCVLENTEMRASLGERHQERLHQIETAFDRLEHGSYGVCEKCGEQISVERLKALPFAIYCIDCQREHEVHQPLRAIGAPFVGRLMSTDEIEETLEDIDPELPR
jgi:DnaK suppressor protein